MLLSGGIAFKSKVAAHRFGAPDEVVRSFGSPIPCAVSLRDWGPMEDVFVSYRRVDRPRVRNLVEILLAQGISVWWDQEVEPGLLWRKQISDKLQTASVVVVIWTESSVGWVGDFVHDEAAAAKSRGVYLPILLDDVLPPIGLREIQAINLVGWDGSSNASEIETMISAIRRRIRNGPSKEVTAVQSVAESHASEYTAALKAQYAELPWSDRSIQLSGVTDNGEIVNARRFLQDWSSSQKAGSLVIVGEFGSGKTGLLRWLAAELAGRADIRTALLSCRDILDEPPRSLADIRTLARPTPGPLNWVDQTGKTRLLLLLDGLDEVMDPTDRQLSNHKLVLNAVKNFIPENTQIALTCRTLFYQAVADDITPIINAPKRRGVLDRTEKAITDAMQSVSNTTAVLHLIDITQSDADQYMGTSVVAKTWQQVGKHSIDESFTCSPFSLRLLEYALPEIDNDNDNIDLDLLYEIATKAMLHRDARVDVSDVSSVLDSITDLVDPNALGTNVDDDAVSAALSCGILVEGRSRRLGFRHRSYYEFFMSRLLSRQIDAYDAATLARLNLIGSYNLCRFLVPNLIRRYSIKLPRETHSSPAWLSSGEYAEFCSATGWRKEVGYGWHPYASSSQAPEYTTDKSLDLTSSGFEASDLDQELPATAISWFDLAQYCRWSGRKLYVDAQSISPQPTPIKPDDLISWTGDWADERRAYIKCLRPAETWQSFDVLGVNPDYRSNKLGALIATELA